MGHLYLPLLLFLLFVFFIPTTPALQTYQGQVLLQLRKHLEYPSQLDFWENYNGDLCNVASTAHMSLSCEDNFVSELKIMGDSRLVEVSDFNGFAVSNRTLSESFSIDSFVTTLTRLTRLRVLRLVSLGIWGALPDKIHRLYSLELLDLSSNFMFGSVPLGMSRMANLSSLTLDSNYFNGTVPDWFDLLSNLTVLSMKSNRFTGPFPSSICKITTLTDLSLSHNELSGRLPDLSTLPNLKVLDLRENKFDSGLPGMSKGLVTALLSKNGFSGKIPEQFSELGQLQHLDISFNNLIGTPPFALFSLPNISYLNLASNKLSGSLPNHLTCGDKLGFIDISANKLIGELPSCLDNIPNERVVMFSGNCLSIDAQHQHEESYCREANVKGEHSRRRLLGILVAVVGGVVLIMVLLAFPVYFLHRTCCFRSTFEQHMFPKVAIETSSTGISSEVLANARIISEAAKLGTQVAPVCHLFSLEELKEATNNFDLSTFMGEGSIGKIYKGRLENGTYVAIRSLSLLKKQSIQNLKVRLDLLSKLHHPHLVGLLGHCILGGVPENSSTNKIFLVYEFLPNGSYGTHLSENFAGEVLKWPERLAILIGVAKAVHYLHTGVIPGNFDNRLKTNNILLDEHRIAKLSDYGMSIITEEFGKLETRGDGSKTCQGTNIKDDVYNFGFILLESLVGPIVCSNGEAFLLNEMASFSSQDGRKRIVDPVVLTTCCQESLSIAISITKKCISPEPSSRPSFEDVLWNLQYAAQVQATADTEQKSDSTSQS
ncbi:probable inactive leucine-rich repeat receptor-like protein kinase At3g03770 isoform X2 [Tripterygium wilfordii]|uniref:probable inactive leucine-rich repeat receptor-like protein kinase At3g03770 isoform X2 n=1 Tax=Tripterygium wilfordii TaxID=458696 RepID=UPI0018F82442|nr:probable inactive leucine-rich repeat receptor-like protein kinase At3g03770 isoform X2 [Tripterygium wilfordii]